MDTQTHVTGSTVGATPEMKAAATGFALPPLQWPF
jgi:hypothetical protein